MATVNVEIQDKLINDQVGDVAGFEIMKSTVKNFISSFRIQCDVVCQFCLTKLFCTFAKMWCRYTIL